MFGSSSPSSGFGSVPSGPALEPRLKRGQRAVNDELPTEYNTKIGKLRVPRDKNPPPPTPQMIADAREGRLDRHFRSGKIIRASEFVWDVIPSTAVLTVNEIYDYQTRPLSVHDRVNQDQKTIRNLFYVALAKDELPSYHFWIKPEDPDPVERQGVNCSEEFEKNSLSPGTAARIAEMETQRNAMLQRQISQEDEDGSSDEDEEPLGSTSRSQSAGREEASAPEYREGGIRASRSGDMTFIKAVQDAEEERRRQQQLEHHGKF